MSKPMHTMRDGTEIAIADMDDHHLQCTIKLIEKAAKRGIMIHYFGSSRFDDFYYDCALVRGKRALDELNYEDYTNELVRRQAAKRPVKTFRGAYLPFGV